MLAGFGGQLALFVSGVVAARALGVEDRGHLALLALFAGILSQVGSLGLPVAATYYIAQDPTRSRPVLEIIRRVAVVQIAVLLIVHVVIVIAVMGTEDGGLLLAGLISLVALPSILIQTYGLAVLQGQGRFDAFNVLRLLPVVTYALAILVAASLHIANLQVVVALWVLTLLGSAVWTTRCAQKPLAIDTETEAPPVKVMLRLGIKGFLGSASPLETFRLDMAVVGLLLSPAALGLYVAAAAFTNLPRFLAQSVGIVAYPAVAQLPSAEGGRRLMWRFSAFVAVISLAVVVAIELAAGWLVPTMFGKEFEGAVAITRVLLVSAFFLSVRRVLSDAARGAGQPVPGTVAEIVSWVALVPALVVLTPPLGATGVAWALTVSSAVGLGVLIGMLVLSGRAARSV